jgi:hypothetical protein
VDDVTTVSPATSSVSDLEDEDMDKSSTVAHVT